MGWIESIKEADKVIKAIDGMSNSMRQKYFKHTSLYDIITSVPQEALAEALDNFEKLKSLKVGSIVKYFNKVYVCVDACKAETCSLLSESGEMYCDVEKAHLEIIGGMPLVETIKIYTSQLKEEELKDMANLILNRKVSKES